MKTKLRVLATAAVLSMTLVAAPVPAEAAVDPADRAAALINLGSRIQSFYDSLADRLAARGRTALADRLRAIGERINTRFIKAACARDPSNPAC